MLKLFARSALGSWGLRSTKVLWSIAGAAFIASILVACSGIDRLSSRQRFVSNTWSIVAADARSGDVGLAVASCVPDFHADVTAALVPGLGVAATQAEFDLANRDRVFDLLRAGEPANAIIDRMSDLGYDASVSTRQYGVVTIEEGQSEVAAFTGSANFPWAGQRQEPAASVTAQGNFLVGEEVVTAALAAFTSDDPTGYNALPDRLMRALEAGSAAGGDARCNNDQVTQTAATAVIMVARGGDAPYAIERVGATDAGTLAAPWLALSVTESRFGPNPIDELRSQYDAWRQEHLERPAEDPLGQRIALWAVVALLLVIAAVVVWSRARRVTTSL